MKNGRFHSSNGRYTLATSMNIEFNNNILFWRGPAPWFFVAVPAQESRELKEISKLGGSFYD